MKSAGFSVFASAIAVLAAQCFAGEIKATSAATAFSLDTASVSPIALSSSSQVSSLANWPITWRKGETVTACAPDGTVHEFVSDASATGSVSVASYIDAGGVWTFRNSLAGPVKFAVAWSVFGDGGTLASDTIASIFVDTQKDGPDRTARTCETLPISFSGDCWSRNPAAASTLTLTSPSSASTVTNLIGTGAYSVRLKEYGVWTVSLAADSPRWARDRLSVNADGNIVLDVKAKGMSIVLR